ncbi:MAG: respiratory nitrate reductase subunit gamma [Pyrinomonadaceae bacterium]
MAYQDHQRSGHLIGFLFPKEVLWFNGVPVRLYILETTGLLFGLLALIGIVALMWRRRIRMPRIRAVTSTVDTVVLVLPIRAGRSRRLRPSSTWGSSWYAASAVPYLRSLFLFQPDVEMIKPLPHIVKTHIINAFVLIAIFPFSRLVHMVSLPIEYLWRPYQVVIWNWDRKKIRGQYSRSKAQVKEESGESSIGTASISR